MHLLALPRHRIETTLADYGRILASLVGPADRPDLVQQFEDAFKAYVGCRHAVAVSSGRLAIHLILEALDLCAGDEVIVPAFNLFAAIERFCQFGLIPRFGDICSEDLNIDSDGVEPLISPRTKVLLATHMFGHPADMRRLTALAKEHNLFLLEDCAHALGTRARNQHVGTFGRASIFSFSVLKLVTTFGGGMIATNDDALAARIRSRLASLRQQQPPGGGPGWKRALSGALLDMGTRRLMFSFGAWPMLRLLRAIKPGIQRKMMTEAPRLDRNFDPAHVSPLHPFQARLGKSQLARTEQLIERRRRVGRWLDEELAGMGGVFVLRPSSGGQHNGLYFGILADRHTELSEYLFRHGIDSETSEYLNCADLEMYREFQVDCPVARDVQSRVLRLPNYPSLTRSQVARIGRTIRAFYHQ